MITLVLTNRNRDLHIVKNCLDSLKNQSSKDFNCFLVDYGSDINYGIALQEVLVQYSGIEFISCPVSGQLWNKCRAINIALKKCQTAYFLVGDIDLLFHPNFVSKAQNLANPKKIYYFQYGFLSQQESSITKKFEEYIVEFKGTNDVTGTTLFPANILKKVNGYDEFYHGWGAEDTDIHMRLKALGIDVKFHKENILIKHQWHPKAYRSKKSSSPFHSNLERVNHSYMQMTINNEITTANSNKDWGVIPNKENYNSLIEKPDFVISILPIDIEFSALLSQFKNFNDKVVKVQINEASFKNKAFQWIKKSLKKKYFNYLKLETLNNLLLEEIIKHYRNEAYTYNFNRDAGMINLTIYFS
jgi:glycosyltransferase involved in cell wall biosynthesis